MIINQFAGSGGDALPWYFRKSGIGPLIGHQTWGGLVGVGGYPVLMDGGRVESIVKLWLAEISPRPPRMASTAGQVRTGSWECDACAWSRDFDKVRVILT